MASIEIAHLCRLAQLALTEPEQTAALADLQRIISMIDEMQAMDTDGVEPLAHPIESDQRLRPDVVSETVDREHYQQGAPATRDGLYLVPRVVE
ncbi:MAG: Asp-tRNA(Asn)/Glu-tRNA(Gln) amidotransferase subunit GatC [Pseudomonadales bacterium]|nr:Asp-tRNA(Asn)/Glu-tRNA(Gln) amidotransferase subunit GatC [Pseudomonadales bacterium]NIX06876.1 Asp-tRNA(Asn)/Glu-tRNA(Gln) amidotransferase subunit GatC [Pseudomonadales bacterium]